MSTIIRTPFRVQAAQNFIDKYAPTASTDKLYLGIGHDTPWTVESNPPVPLNSIAEGKSTYDSLLGAKAIAKTDMCMVVPRIDYLATTEYFVYDETLENPWSTSSYVLTSTFSVYKVTAKDVSGLTYANPPLAVNEPTGTGTGIDTLDGYIWEFLYDLAPADQLNLLSATWMPVNYGSAISGLKESALQTSAGDVSAFRTLESKYVMLRVRLLEADLDLVTYRKIAVIVNPLDVSTGVVAASTLYLNPSDPNNATLPGQNRQFVQYSGDMIYQENRTPVTRTVGQFEEMKIIVEF